MHRTGSRTAWAAWAFAIFANTAALAWAPSDAATGGAAPRGVAPVLANPYRNFRVQIRIDAQVVAGFAKMTLLDPQGKVAVFQQGVSHSASFEAWASTSTQPGGGGRPSASSRKDVAVDIVDERGQLKRTHLLRACVVAEYEAMPDLDAGAHAVSIAAVKFVCAGGAVPYAPNNLPSR